MRRLAAVAMVVMALMLSACTSSTVPSPTTTTTVSKTVIHGNKVKPTGAVTGVAYACWGTAGSPPPVTVLLYSGSRFIASKTVASGKEYRLTAKAGMYTVKLRQEQGSRSFQPYRPKGVLVRAGRTVTANFPAICI